MRINIKQPVRNIQRWREVQGILLRYGFDVLFDKKEISEIREVLKDKLKISVGEFDKLSTPERMRLMLEELGPTYVKLGQVLSSRTDLLPEAWLTELVKLQDTVPSFPLETVNRTIEKELGKPPREIFLDFDETPLAAASIGQVHRATLKDLSPVVVKIQRPGIEKQIVSDLEIMRQIAQLIENRTAIGKKYRPVDIVDDFTKTLLDEIDYTNEASNADRLRRNMADQKGIHVPAIYWELTTNHILTMEAINGVKINNLAKIDEAGIDRTELATRFINSIFHQVLFDGFYHMDPHPGNLLVNLEDQSLNYIDLGMMGRLLPEQRDLLVEMIQAIIQNDSRQVVRTALVLGTPVGDVDLNGLQRAVDKIIGRYLNASLEQISLAPLINEIMSTFMKYQIRLPSELTLSVKPLIQGEGVAFDLDPSLQIIDIVRSVYRQVLRHRMDPQYLTTEAVKAVRETNRLLHKLPPAMDRLLDQVQDGSFGIRLEMDAFSHHVHRLETSVNRLTNALALAGMIIGSAIAMGVSPQNSYRFIPIIGTVGFVISMGFAFILVWTVLVDNFLHRKKRK